MIASFTSITINKNGRTPYFQIYIYRISPIVYFFSILTTFFSHEKIKEFDGSMFEGDLKKIDLDIDKFEVFFKNLKDTTNEKVIRTMLKKIKIY